ncbi:MAG: hypothetical protein ACT4OI_06910 [Methanobacteriota archaeon]
MPHARPAPWAWSLATIVLAGIGLVQAPLAEADAGFAWSNDVLLGDVDLTGPAALALDSAGRPHVAFADATSGAVWYGGRTSGVWDIRAIPGAGNAEGGVRLAFDGSDAPHVVYFDGSRRAVMYARDAGTGWVTSVVDRSHLEGHTGLVLAPDDTPHVAYAWDNGRLRHAWLSGGSWASETVDPNVVTARYTSVALDPDGRPEVAYYGNGQLWHAHWVGYRWDLAVVDPTTSPEFVTLRTDATGGRWIAYRARGEAELRLAHWNGSAWSREIVDSNGDVGWDASLALDVAGQPHISYYDRDVAVLRYARREADAWARHIPDRRFVTGWFSAIAVGTDGRPHFAYYSWPERSVRYAFGGAGLGVRTWPPRDVTATSAVLVGELTSVGNATGVDVVFEWRAARGEWQRGGAATLSERGFVSFAIEGLEPATAHQARFVATAGDEVVSGETVTFSTSAVAPRGVDPVIAGSLFAVSGAGVVGLGFYLARHGARRRAKGRDAAEPAAEDTRGRERML